MSELLDKQLKFGSMVAKLLPFILELGYAFKFGDAFRDPRCPYGSPNSLHRMQLAIDILLFVREDGDWKYLTLTEEYEPIGLYWESLGGSWGGRFDDGNHFSLEHGGHR